MAKERVSAFEVIVVNGIKKYACISYKLHQIQLTFVGDDVILNQLLPPPEIMLCTVTGISFVFQVPGDHLVLY